MMQNAKEIKFNYVSVVGIGLDMWIKSDIVIIYYMENQVIKTLE